VKTVLVVGTTGQDGVCPSEFPFKKGYEVHEIKHLFSNFNTRCIDCLYQDLCVENKYFIPRYFTSRAFGFTIRYSLEKDIKLTYSRCLKMIS
jgi:hypothetical protein